MTLTPGWEAVMYFAVGIIIWQLFAVLWSKWDERKHKKDAVEEEVITNIFES